MKHILIHMSLSLAAKGTLVLFICGLLWSLVPLGGITLPHWLGTMIGLSFIRSALLVSILLGIMCVGSMVLSHVIVGREQ